MENAGGPKAVRVRITDRLGRGVLTSVKRSVSEVNMKFLNRRFLGVLGICATVAVVAAAQSARPPAKKWPPQFPREGATKLFENDHVIVWEQVGRPKEPFMHMHVRDTIVFGIENGRVDTLAID